jgi:hypothetical protein
MMGQLKNKSFSPLRYAMIVHRDIALKKVFGLLPTQMRRD